MESFKEICKSPGYQSLKQTVLKDCKKDKNCFNISGCDKTNTCSTLYCNTFKWVIDRAKHYSYKTGISISKILNSWEDNRDYWYMNYYQNSNQPKIKGKNFIVVETVDDAHNLRKKGFRCPACEGISTNSVKCNSGKKLGNIICDWKAYGLFGTMGKGLNVFIKETVISYHIFMPIIYEEQLMTNKS